MTTVTPETATRRRAERLAGVVVALAGVVLLVASVLIPEPVRESPGMGPRVMPTVVSLGLLVSGVLLVLTAARRHDEGIEETLLDERSEHELAELLDPDEAPVPWRGLVVVLGLLVLFAVAFIPLGFILSTALFLGVVTTWADPGRWVRNWIFAAALPVAVYFLFTELLMVSLPAGVLG